MSKTICGAKTRAGTPCRKSPMKGKKRCRNHGGATPGGPLSVHFKTGRYSKYLPEYLKERYEESLKDPELLSLNQELAAVDSRINQLMARAQTNESSEKWQQIKVAILNMEATLNDRSGKKSAEQRARDLKIALQEAKAIMRSGCADEKTWQEIQNLLDLRRKLTDSEQRRLERMNQFITSQDAFGLISQVLDSIKRNVTDKGAKARIAADIQRVMSPADS